MVKVSWVSMGLRRVSRCLVLPAAVTLAGCSFVFVDAPPEHPERIPPKSAIDCTTSRAAPIVDTLITAFQLVRTALAANANDEEYVDAPISREADLGAGIFLATGFGVSAIWGHVSTSQCASLKAERAPERAQDRPDASREATKAPPPERSPEPPPPTPPSPSWGR